MNCPDCFKLIAPSFPLHECRVVIRYYIVPASARGWVVRRDERINGQEQSEVGWILHRQTKREAETLARQLNKALGDAYTPKGIETNV